MQPAETRDCRNPSQRFARSWVAPFIWTVMRLVARGAFEILRLLQPVILPTLFWLAAGGVALWVIFVPIAHDDGFPTTSVLGMSVGCVLGALGYCVLLESLRPTGR
jgi:hypothetical protein